MATASPNLPGAANPALNNQAPGSPKPPPADAVIAGATPVAAQEPKNAVETAYEKKDQATELSLSRQECAAGRVESCNLLGTLLTQGVDADIAAGRAVLDRSCGQQSAAGCVILANSWVRQKKPDYAKARPLFEKACILKNGDGCANLGAMQLRGLGSDPDRAAGIATLQRACETLNNRNSCAGLGTLCRHEEDYTRARPFVEKSCALGDKDSCVDLGIMQVKGMGGTPDRPAGIATLIQACETLNNRRSCANLGSVYADQDAPGGPNMAAAAKALMKGCDLGDMLSCRAAGILLIERPGVTPDPVASFRALSLACGSGDNPSCLDMRRLRGRFPPEVATPAAYQAAYEKACRSPDAVHCIAAALDGAEVAATPEAFTAASGLAELHCLPNGNDPMACRARDLLRAISQELRTCQAGSTTGCGRLSAQFVVLIDEFKELDRVRALALPTRYARAACDAGVLEGCAAVPWVWYLSGSKAPFDTVAPFVARACEGNVALGCEFGGWMHLKNLDEKYEFLPLVTPGLGRDNNAAWRSFRLDWQTTRAYLTKGCSVGWAEGCIALIVRHLEFDLEFNQEQALPADAVLAACKMTRAQRCFEIASTLLAAEYQRGTYNITTLAKSGCVVPEAVCRALGRWYNGWKGSSLSVRVGNSRLAQQGLVMMDQACTQGSVRACVFMAQYHLPDSGATSERQVNWPLAESYARKILALEPGNPLFIDFLKRIEAKVL